MSLPFLHSTADVMQSLLIQMGLADDPMDTGTAGIGWPAFVADEPSEPDNAITCYDTTPIDDGRIQTDGECIRHPGVQVRVRGRTHAAGFAKADALRRALNEDVYDELVNISGSRYLVHCVNGAEVLFIGRESPETRRRLFTINATVTLDRTL